MRAQPADGFEWIDTPEGAGLRCRALDPFARHVFTTREWRLGSAANGTEAMTNGWAQLAQALAVEPSRLSRVHQVHGADVAIVRRGDEPHGAILADADVVMSDDPARALAIQTADCVPLLFADRRTGVVCAAHAGWRGLAARVPAIAVDALARAFGSAAADLVAAIGPSISADRYEVGSDVRARFEAAGFANVQIARWFPVETRHGHWLFDGWQAARDQLEAGGLAPASIHIAGLCTATYPDLFCSYRRDGAKAGRLAAAIRPRRKATAERAEHAENN